MHAYVSTKFNWVNLFKIKAIERKRGEKKSSKREDALLIKKLLFNINLEKYVTRDNLK